MINRIKNIKLFILHYKYKHITNIILRLQKHIDFLFLNNFINFLQKNHILNIIFLISKNLNSSYNNYIVDNLEKEDNLSLKLTEILIIFNDNMTDEIVFDKIFPIIKKFEDEFPLSNHEIEIINVISDFGFDNLEDLLKIYNSSFVLSVKQNEILNEINKIFIPIKIKCFDVSNCKKEYYWRKPSYFDENDLLKLNRELWIKNKESKTKYLKIEGYFMNDSLSSFIKTSQLNYPILQKNKSNILNKFNNKSIDPNFIKKFIRYDYLGNIYSMNFKDYLKYVERLYKIFIEASNSTFMNIMKNFISKDSDIQTMFEYIFLLLLGTSDNIDVAGLLLGLTKEKKSNNQFIYNYLIQRLPYYLIVKIKKSHNNIKFDLDKIKSISIDDIDYKKQLVINKNIPSSVKAITLEKIEEMKSSNNEYYKQLTFVKHILNFPWSSNNEITISNPSEYLNNIESKLNNLSYGHDMAKKSLLQTIGKWISNPSSQGTCFGLVGPPGVGKTLLAKSISKALDIPFSEITLGGQNDGEILHGHGYTYSGSQPGLIIKKMVEMGKSRCILYFDELDKACSKHGSINEITSILIHLTDPNMNKTFQDRFFQGVDFPLDKAIIIFSYNDPKLVDPILLDRIKQIEVSAYNIIDKKKIVKNFIIPELVNSIGLNNELWTTISEDLIEYIIENYTNEAGVRSIKRQIEEIFLTLNLNKIYQRNEFKNNNNFKEITKEIITTILNSPKNEITKIHEKDTVGVINGLYATNNCEGGIIHVQIFNNFLSNSSSYEIKLTGNQGNVMKESVHCSLTTAFNYIKNNLHKYPEIINFDEYLTTNFKYGFHVHAPSTSTPKDGPSAGCAFTSAFISRILNKPIKNYIAMTGEIELTGKITKIGGLSFKLFGAKKAGVKMVYVPKENESDLTEIINKNLQLIDDNFKVKTFDYIDEIIDEIM
jgi:endopeptidase La